MKPYKTLINNARVEFTEKKSLFIGHARHVKTEDEAAELIRSVREEHAAATHNVFAYILKYNNLSKFSDDGEPHGTAGLPVLEILRKNEIFDAAIVVTRYFGGIKLGAGGLVRAYTAAAKNAVDSAGIGEVRLYINCKMICAYSDFERLKPIISSLCGKIGSVLFTNEIECEIQIAAEFFDGLNEKINEITAGKIGLSVISKEYIAE